MEGCNLKRTLYHSKKIGRKLFNLDHKSISKCYLLFKNNNDDNENDNNNDNDNDNDNDNNNNNNL
ncbi:hypothetical protein H8356DRAFT_1342855 [Neocallimastix lanati (nom. inval.)]|nr:hypothetical protein H8356DRAFT_1342855 [Neocallimastix sp. JGI-2020a]